MSACARCLALATLVVITACGGADDRSQHQDSTGPSSTTTNRTVDAGTSSPHATAVDPPTSDPTVAARTCRRRQRTAVETLDWRLAQAGNRLTSAIHAPSGAGAASLSLAYHLRTALGNLRTDCGRVPQAARHFLATGLRATGRPLTDEAFRRTVLAFGPWSVRVDGRDASRSLIRSWTTCRRLAPQVRAGYAVWWDFTPRGTDWWVQLLLDNDLDVKLEVNVGGSLWAAGHPEPAEPLGPLRHHGIPALEFTWGGSSSDYYYAEPHRRTTKFVGIGEFYKVHLPRNGYFFDIRPELSVNPLHPADGNWLCALPVPRAN